MIQGVHARSTVFVGLQAVGAALHQHGGLWTVGALGTDVVPADGHPEARVLRITGLTMLNRTSRTAGHVLTCNVQLEAPGQESSPQLRAAVRFTEVAGSTNTKITLEGSAARRLIPDRSANASEIVEVGNRYARQIVDSIAAQLERLAGPQASPQPGPVASPRRLKPQLRTASVKA